MYEEIGLDNTPGTNDVKKQTKGVIRMFVKKIK